MRLVNATTLKLAVFNDTSRRPPYTILSHRWVENHEITFDDIQRPHRRLTPAWRKIEMACRQTLVDNLNYIWVDTCCIDKSSSTELSEAINSMYTWYSNAEYCYAHLNDVHFTPRDRTVTSPHTKASLYPEMVEDVMASKWFTRAWTLQELIAPKKVVFYDAQFQRLGPRSNFSNKIESMFGITEKLLSGSQQLFSFSVAEKMSWAANRQASRIEDIAYSLFGLFDVNLPLLYGEGMKAFQRLQEEIVRQTYDHSIFVWGSDWESRSTGNRTDVETTSKMPLLAASPADFKIDQNYVTHKSGASVRPYTMTNIGLQIELEVIPYDLNVYVGLLNCGPHVEFRYGILLTRQSEEAAIWQRVSIEGLDVVAIQRSRTLTHFNWRQMYINRHTYAVYDKSEDELWRGTLQIDTSFYGLHIRAPDFFSESDGSSRPYTLVADHDWDRTVQPTSKDQENMGDRRHDSRINKQKGSNFTHDLGPKLSVEDLSLLSGLRSFSHEIFGVFDKMWSPALVAYESGASLFAQSFRAFNDHRRVKLPQGVLVMPPVSTGTAGMVVFDDQIYGIKSIEAGFGFDFCPTVVLTTHEATLVPSIVHSIRSLPYAPLKLWRGSSAGIELSKKGRSQYFLSLTSDAWRSGKDLEPEPLNSQRRPICVERGVYVCAMHTNNQDHATWIFNPYKYQEMTLFIELQKTADFVNDSFYWELRIHRLV